MRQSCDKAAEGPPGKEAGRARAEAAKSISPGGLPASGDHASEVVEVVAVVSKVVLEVDAVVLEAVEAASWVVGRSGMSVALGSPSRSVIPLPSIPGVKMTGSKRYIPRNVPGRIVSTCMATAPPRE